jgi:four helix bundle protein
MASSYEDLEIWKAAHTLTLKIYKVTLKWPTSEKYGLISQTRRAAVSVELVIAEAQSRFFYKDTIRMLYEARGSAEEVRNCLLLARDIEEIDFSAQEYDNMSSEYLGVIKGINGFIKNLLNKHKFRLTDSPIN